MAFASLLLICAVAPWELSGFWPVTRDYFPQSVALCAAAFAALMLALSPQTSKAKLSPLARCIIAFFACNCFSFVTAVYQHDAILELARLAGVLAWFFIARRLLILPEDERVFARATLIVMALIIGALSVCGLAIVEFLRTRANQPSTFYNANLFANYAALSLPLCVCFAFALRRFLPSNLALGIGVLVTMICGGGALISGSKGGFLAAFIGVIVCVIAIWRARSAQLKIAARRHGKVLGLGTVVLLSVGGALFVKTVGPRLQRAGGSENHSTMFRVYAWKSTLQMIEARPFLGHGPGSFPSAYTQFAQAGYTRSAHQSWLQIAAESGVPSLLFVLGALVLALRNGAVQLKTARWPIAAGAVGALCAMLVHGSIDAGWGIFSIALAMMVILALLDENEMRESENAPRLNLGWLLLMLPLALGASYGMQAQSAENLSYQADELLKTGNRDAALKAAQAATENAPLDARAWANLGQMRIQNNDRDGAIAAYRKAHDLQPTKASHVLRLAQLLDVGGAEKMAEEWYNRAIALDPRDIGLRIQRAQWLEKQGRNVEALEDYERIVQAAGEPYGRYPAIPEIVDLDFNRARLKLIEHDLQTQKYDDARVLMKEGRADLERARDFLKTQPDMVRALQESGQSVTSESDIEAQARAFDELQKRLDKERTKP